MRVPNPSKQRPISMRQAGGESVRQVQKMRAIDFASHPAHLDYDQAIQRKDDFDSGLGNGGAPGTVGQ